MRFLVDAQLPPALVKHILSLGHEASHVSELGLRSATDKQIWNRAMRTRAVLLTKDEDFVALRRNARDGPGIVWIRIGNTTNATLVSRLLPILSDIVAAIEAGEFMIEVR